MESGRDYNYEYITALMLDPDFKKMLAEEHFYNEELIRELMEYKNSIDLEDKSNGE